jgi:hypothetical protein
MFLRVWQCMISHPFSQGVRTMAEKRAGFLARHKAGPAGRTVYEPWEHGFLRLQYDDDGLVEQAAWTPRQGQTPRGDQPQLWFMWINDMVTYKTENGLSGTCWSSGRVALGTVYDDDGDSAPGTETALEEWVDQCVADMVADGATR